MGVKRPSNDYRDYLAHHGVKGMRWGHRKKETSPISSAGGKGVLDPNKGYDGPISGFAGGGQVHSRTFGDRIYGRPANTSLKNAGSILGGVNGAKPIGVKLGERFSSTGNTKNRLNPLSWEQIDKADRDANKRGKEYNEVYYDKFTGETVKNKGQEYKPSPGSTEDLLRKVGKAEIGAERVSRAVGKGIKFLSGGLLGMVVSTLSKKKKKGG